eukprot:1835254-Pyramimonas_sp.AAC.1
MHPRRPKMASRWPKTAQKASKRPPRRSKGPPRRPPGGPEDAKQLIARTCLKDLTCASFGPSTVQDGPRDPLGSPKIAPKVPR